MKQDNLITRFLEHPNIDAVSHLLHEGRPHLHLSGLMGSGGALAAASLFTLTGKQQHFIILPEKEQAAYFYNDLENLFDEAEVEFGRKKVLFFPTTYKRPYAPEKPDRAYQLSRTEVLNRFITGDRKTIVVTYPEAMAEKVASRNLVSRSTIKLKVGEEVSLDFLGDVLAEFDFESVDFVAEPGQFAFRGGIVDVFSFSNENPYRIEFVGDRIESIRTFDPANQLSLQSMHRINLLPNVQDRKHRDQRISLLEYLPSNTILWFTDLEFTLDEIDKEVEHAAGIYKKLSDKDQRRKPDDLFTDSAHFRKLSEGFKTIEIGTKSHFPDSRQVEFHQHPQPAFNKNFDLLINDLMKRAAGGYDNYILSDNAKQTERLYAIFEDIQSEQPETGKTHFKTLTLGLSSGFIDDDIRMLCYTDHQIFDRYHRFRLREGFGRKEAISIKELYDLQPGDYVTHIDHGVGRFDGLQIIDNDGKKQEAIRLVYKNNDLLYVSIHSLHRISKYIGKEGTAPVLNRLGSNTWKSLKNKTKKKVKDIARDLIKLYAERKSSKGHSFSPDNYLQNELEASFIYEDTPDQNKATLDVKSDMEASFPMDRLVCGDVGFGKTEVAIRAAFKAVNDSKQVAVLVPTTILALQHYKTFSERLHDFPVTIDYISRFKSAKKQRETLNKLKEGQIDIIIGTHRLLSKDILFKNLGLFVVDEEQKFGVSAKEKLRQKKANVDTLTLTATPIPRTLQFSLMGARDLSIINTPPPNRYPVQTMLRSFGEEVIRDAIQYEVSRGGQVFFVHNRVQNIMDIHDMILRFVPNVRIAVGHGQMDGAHLEKIMIDFIDGEYDVLLATTIIESGLDIPNANTILINEAQNYGLSDLHQLRGRVGRSNKKAICVLLTPPLSTLTAEARKRLQAIADFAELGSGFNIAMRDLDIRGAGNILGAEQSGFISEIGYEMYQKILDEALEELRESEFREMFTREGPVEFVKDCQIETDLELLIPDHYVVSIQERLSLYKELDNLEREEDLKAFEERLVDRFGPLPTETKDLLETMRLRWLAKKVGFEKLILKFGRMTGTFYGTHDSAYFSSQAFGKVLEFIQKNPNASEMKEKDKKLTLRIEGVRTVQQAMAWLRRMTDQNVN